MARPFRFGVQVLDLTDRNTVVAAARQAEALGCAEFYSYDRVGALDPFVPLVVAAEATSRLRVGPLVGQRLGHSSPALTLSIYSHVLPRPAELIRVFGPPMPAAGARRCAR